MSPRDDPRPYALLERGLRTPSLGARRLAARILGELGDNAGQVVNRLGTWVSGQLRAAAQDRLYQFGEVLERESTARIKTLGLTEDADLRFALRDLLPRRTRAAREHLGGRNDQRAIIGLLNFLDVEQRGAIARITAAADTEDVADALTHSLDDLHGYLIAHDLATDRYRLLQDPHWSSERRYAGDSGGWDARTLSRRKTRRSSRRDPHRTRTSARDR